MFKGAVIILKNQQPVLSLCTYHKPSDPIEMQNLIFQANPKYKVIQRRMKLFAYVPEICLKSQQEKERGVFPC